MVLTCPGKTSLWYAGNAGRRHITVSARGLLLSGKWGSGRKSPYKQWRQEHGWTADSLRGKSSVLDACLGGVAVYRCSAGAHRRDAVNWCQWLVHRHLLTASCRQPWRPLPLLPLSQWLFLSGRLCQISLSATAVTVTAVAIAAVERLHCALKTNKRFVETKHYFSKKHIPHVWWIDIFVVALHKRCNHTTDNDS